MTATPAGTDVAARAVTAATRAPLGQRLRGRQNQNLWFWVFVGPFVIELIVFIYLPILWSIYLSFF